MIWAKLSHARRPTLSIFSDDIVSYNASGLGNLDGSLRFSLNRFNYDEMHKKLIPRAVGYSTGMLDYFFRGKMDFVSDSANSGTCAIKNLGNEGMNGTFTLYFDDNSGVRNPVPGASWSLSVPAGQQVGNLAVTTPTPAPTKPGAYTLVFNGTMGQETPTGNSVGAVVAKKLSPNTNNMTVKILSDIFTTDPYSGYEHEVWDYALVNSIGDTISTWKGYMQYFPAIDTRVYSNWFCGSAIYPTGVTVGCDPYVVFSGASSIIPDLSRPSDLTPEILKSTSSYPLIVNAVGGDLIEISRPPGYTAHQAKPCAVVK